jgi:hypothetical protein
MLTRGFSVRLDPPKSGSMVKITVPSLSLTLRSRGFG